MEKEVLKLSSEEAKNIVYEESEEFNTVYNKITGNGRWSIYHEIVIQRNSDSKYFKSTYSEGATESQDESPYDYGDAIFTEVFPKKVEVIIYE